MTASALRAEDLLRALPDPVVIAGPDRCLVLMNDAARRLHGFPLGEERPLPFDTFADRFEVRDLMGRKVDPEDWPVTRILRGETVGDMRLRVDRLDIGLTFVGSFSGCPIHGDDGAITHAVVAIRDVSREQALRDELRGHEMQLRHVLDSVGALVGVASPEGILLEVNRPALQLAGKQRKDVIDRPLVDTFWGAESPQARDKLREAIDRASDGHPVRYDTAVLGGGDNRVEVELQLRPIVNGEGRVTHLVPSAIDISERRNLEARLRAESSFKDVLLKEMNHRIKNSLQMVSALLHMQRAKVRSDSARKEFDSAVARIQTIAALHSRLYQQDSVLEVELGPLLEQLAQMIRETLLVDNEARITVRQTGATIPTDQAIPVVLIVNELVTNAVKHGIRDAAEGEVRITLDRARDGTYQVVVADNGRGMRRRLGASRRGLGAKLITALTAQIDGRLRRLRVKKGTAFELSFRSNRDD